MREREGGREGEGGRERGREGEREIGRGVYEPWNIRLAEEEK